MKKYLVLFIDMLVIAAGMDILFSLQEPLAAEEETTAISTVEESSSITMEEELAESTGEESDNVQPPHASKGLSLSGKAKEKGTGRGIEGIKVELSHDQSGSYSAITDANGNYRITGIGPGKCYIQIDSGRYVLVPDSQGDWREVFISNKDIDGIDFEFILGGSISGNVVNSRGEYISGAILAIKKYDGIIDSDVISSGTGITESDGKFILKGIAPGSEYVVVASHPEYAEGKSQNIEVKSGEETNDVRVVMSSGSSISGRITSATGHAIEGARIKATLTEPGLYISVYFTSFEFEGEDNIKSDADGEYIIPHLLKGKYIISVQAKGYAPTVKRDIEVEEGKDTKGMDLVLSAGNFISGMVTDEKGAPVSGASIWAHSADSDLIREERDSTTDDKGHYRLESLGEGLFDLSCTANGYGNERKQQVAVNSSDIDFTLKKKGVIIGQVISEITSEPITSFAIWIMCTEKMSDNSENNFSIPGQDFYSEQGEFKIEVEEGNCSLDVSADGFANVEIHNVKVESGKTTDGVIIRLGMGSSVTGYVLSETGRTPISGAKVRIEGPIGGRMGTNEIMTDTDGSFLFEHLAPGNFSISTSHPEYAGVTVSKIQVVTNQTKNGVEILLSTGGKIEGHVYDENSKPVSGSMVTVESTDMRETYPVDEPATTDEQGYYKVEGLKSGSYYVVSTTEKAHFSDRTEMKQVNVNAGETITVDFNMEGGCRLYGVVMRAGEPGSGFNVMVNPKDYFAIDSERMSSGTAMTNDQGFYEIKSFLPGEYTLTLLDTNIEDESHITNCFAIQIQDASEMEYNINLTAGATLLGSVVTASRGVSVKGQA